MASLSLAEQSSGAAHAARELASWRVTASGVPIRALTQLCLEFAINCAPLAAAGGRGKRTLSSNLGS